MRAVLLEVDWGAVVNGPEKIRILVVDDSVIARRFITRRLAQDDEIDVIGTAASGATALARIRRDPPDVVILDEEMPDMRGRDVLKVIRSEHPTVAVVMFSGHIGRTTQARFEALLLGADDAVAKPTASGGHISDEHPIWSELLRKAKAAARSATRGGVSMHIARTSLPPPSLPSLPSPPPLLRPVRRRAAVAAVGASHPAGIGVCVIGSSTGGPDALRVLFSALPHDFPLPILIAQHMPPDFTKLLADRLNGHAALTVVEATGGEQLRAGTAYLAPGDTHLVIKGRALGCETSLQHGPPENSCRPAADVLFRSAAEVFGARTVACVISGMGRDGMLGAIDLHHAGATIIAQDQATSVVWGMPGAVVNAGVAHKVLPLSQIAAELTASARGIVSRGSRRREVSA
ncbi:MAG: two-component system chemotaxis response regulator CheB [Nitriliruptoraceae bacterium]